MSASRKNERAKKAKPVKTAQRPSGPAKGKKAAEHQKAAAQAEKENARVQAEREASPDGQTASERAMEKVYDPNRCATPRCKGEPVMTYLEKPLCQKCWDRVAAKAAQEDVAETVAAIESGNLTGGMTIPTGQAPRSELTLEVADKLAKVRKAKKQKADKPKRTSALELQGADRSHDRAGALDQPRWQDAGGHPVQRDPPRGCHQGQPSPVQEN